MLTTASMIRLGKVYGNLMVDLRATNNKLRDRATRIVAEATGLSKVQAAKLLASANGQAKTAIVMHFRKTDYAHASEILARCNGLTRKAIAKN
jgi:N-acetylmuramic acid 6-phosphate etherase